MALLEWGSRRFTVPAGEVVAGSDAACAVQVTGPRVLARHAVLQGQADGQVVIRKATPEAEVLINGVRLGGEPTPLLHGDKVDLGGAELTFVDERRSGSTQYIQAVQVPQAAAAAKAEARGAAGAGAPTANTGGRVVSLTDGREYAITGASLVFGREAGCDVVVPGKDVSRRHAEIIATPKGYVIVDQSTNGTFVNDQRVEGQRLLARADVIRLGEETFRFYADAAPAPAPPAPQPAPPAPPAPGAGQRLQNTSFGVPSVKRGEATVPTTPAGAAPAPPPAATVPARPSSSALATFLVRAGALKGQRVQVRTPIVNIGRADYNDIVLPDESVSTSHAKLQRREGVWVLVDLESTNGTWVDGERVKDDVPLAPGAVVRFGDVSLVFEPTAADDAMGVAKGGGTKVIQAMKLPPAPAAPSAAPAPAAPKPAAAPAAAAPAPAPARPQPKRPAATAPEPKKGKGCGASAVLLLGTAAALTWILG
jgi:pSer/pThr/pTyr-binding forkhead associated (FHA) protein